MASIDRFEDDEPIGEGPEDLVTKAFSRCQNWPKERLGILGLAQGLKKSAERFSVSMEAIVERCAEISQYCPTDADLLTVGRDLRAAIDRSNEPNKEAEWKLQYGAAKPFDWTVIDKEHVKHVRDREAKLIAAIKAKYPGEIGWSGMAQAARELGYEDYAKAWERGIAK